MEIFKYILIASLIPAGSFAAETTKSQPSRYPAPLEMALSIYNTFGSANRLFAALKIGASTRDEEFLDLLEHKYGSKKLPTISLKDGAIVIQGLEKPLKVVNLGKGLFSYNEKALDLSLKGGIEKSLDEIEKALSLQSAAFWNWLLPQAFANFDPSMMALVVAGVAGLGIAANNCSSDGTGSTLGCLGGSAMAGFSLGYLFTRLFGDNSPSPQGVSCYPGPNGYQRVVVLGPNNVPMTSFVQSGVGQPYSFSPALGQVSGGNAQYMAGQMASMCSYPNTIQAVNTAYSAPNLYPLPARPVALPMRLVPATVKPFPVRLQVPAGTVTK